MLARRADHRAESIQDPLVGRRRGGAPAAVAAICSTTTSRWCEDCPNCGLHFEREPGYFAGALAINIIAVGGLFAIVFVALLALTIPDVPVLPLLIVLVPIMVFGPIVFYPFSKTLWVAVDRAFLQRLDPNERVD